MHTLHSTPLRLVWRLCVCLLVAVALFPLLAADKLHTPGYYEDAVRANFRQGQWEQGLATLKEGLGIYPEASTLNELMGRYNLHHEHYDEARFYLIRALRDNDENVTARSLLVDVEERTGNYSSAICYINELLEGEPYEEGLWNRKIKIYRAQGNEIEADHLLRRLFQIYPNDTTLRSNYIRRLEDIYQTAQRDRNRNSAIATIRELIGINPDSTSYYLDLTNLYLQTGDEGAALWSTGQGLNVNPDSYLLIEKRASILAQQGREVEALGFVKEKMKEVHNPKLGSLYNALLLQAAQDANARDPYVLYGRVYETQHSQEALDYLVNTSITRNYYDDAIYYIKEAKKRGVSPQRRRQLDYDLYVVRRRMGDIPAANTMLAQLYHADPQDATIAEEYAALRLSQASTLISEGLDEDAIPLLQEAAEAGRHVVVEPGTDNETRLSALSHLYTCQVDLKRYRAATATLDTLSTEFTRTPGVWVLRRASLLALEEDTPQALATLRTALDDDILLRDVLPDSIPPMATPAERDSLMLAYEQRLAQARTASREAFIGAYNDVATPYIKGLIEQGATPEALRQVKALVELDPHPSADALRYAITTTALLRHDQEYDRYVALAREMYPDDMSFVAKEADALTRQQRYAEALELLRQPLDSLPADAALIGAFAQTSEDLALREIKENEPRRAMAALDSALTYDPHNRSLLYTKGLAYEKEKLYDSAYVYQKNYQPSLLEEGEFKQHMKGLRSRCARNIIGLEYLQGRYGSEDIITSVGTASYTHLDTKNSYTGTMNYAGRDGNASSNLMADQVPGGVGVQLQGTWSHVFSPRWSGEVSAAWASRYFPTLNLNLGVTRTFANDWEGTARLGWRLINTYRKEFRFDEEVFNEQTGRPGLWVFDHWHRSRQSLISASLGAAKSFDSFRVSARVDGMYMASKVYVNAVADARYMPVADGETFIGVLGAVGTAPEASLIDNAMPASFSRLNSMVGLQGRYLLTPNLSIGLLGTWHTFYSQANGREGTQTAPLDFTITTYKNLFNLSAQIYLKF